MFRVLSVSHSGFYDWLSRTPNKRSRENTRLLCRIRESYAVSDKTYGSPRIVRDLKDWGECCSVNRIAKLMREASIKARMKRR
jgi:putative transposase